MKEDKVRVLEVVSGISPEGIGTFLLNVFENMDDKNIQVDFALATEYKQFYEERLINEGAKIYRTYEIGRGIKGKIKHFINLIKIIKSKGPYDVVHSHMDFFNGINLLAAYIAGTPIRISHAHIAVNGENTSYLKKIYMKIMKFLIRKFSNERLGCSQEANLYINGNKNEVVIKNGINLTNFKEIYKSNKEVDICIDRNKKNIITIGRIEEQKNPEFIVEVIKELVNIDKDYVLWWVGVGTLKSRVEELIKIYELEENIFLLGNRKDVPNLLSNIDYMLFPSKWEGLGIVLIEAQAAGVPCFISDTIPKEADLGLCTILKLEQNAEKWAELIDKYINNKTFKKNIDNKKLNEFDIKYTVNQLKGIYMQ